ncbi:glucose dehydrogenase [FAD, quinone]-like [Pseudomyrmex gracilis]|uniref:glucose dehydrogenase [FAD, quinone]-like n=1 Tax=Pseudomyrmex gracilis TaxID=219809 RepID=UPI00099531FD|nr:glucose dehydrogenase [FAD, quinone]-like [Pseudomyrmex gracilis]
MLNANFFFFLILSIVAVIIPTRSNEIENVIKVIGGVLKFLDEGQDFLNKEIPDMTPQHKEVYDFVIVGAGTAGATIAARLSETHQTKVLLIEAGYNENYLMDVPIMVHYLQLSSDINWKYYTKPSNKYCLGMNNNQCHFPRGKVMGGSSVLNYMIATRGDAEDYNRWAEMGNEGWAYKDILKYFKKLETIDIPELRSDTTYRGTKGPVHVSYARFHTLVAEHFLKAGQELGYPLVDYNAETTIGFSYLQNTLLNGSRISSNRAYLHPIRDRKNLYVTRRSIVNKVLIDRNTNRAIGVQLTKNQQTISVFARKEVILCAGAIASPQLLMLSGIGPSKHLTDLGIDVIRDAPVGDNLMDHVYYGGLTWKINQPLSIRTQDMINIFHNSYAADYLLTHSGPFTIPGACEAVAFVNTKQPEKRSGLPDIELLFVGGVIKAESVIKDVININSQVRQMWNKYKNDFGWSILPTLLKPKSRGRIRLVANDVNVKPEIIPNYYNNPEDVRTMINGIKFAINVSNTKTMQKFNPQLSYDICNNYTYNSYAYWECAIRTLSFTIYHYSGTCKMGPREDLTAVVDPKLKVIGVEGLRVADASIMPEIISGHTNLPVYMIAEKVADMIKEEWSHESNYI